MLNAVSTRVLGHGLKQIQVPAAAFLWQWAAGSFLSTTSCQLLQQEQKHNKNSQSQDLAKQEQQKQRLPRLPDGVIVLPMPALSHTMVSGKVAKWLKSEGDECHIYDLLLEVSTDTLVEEAYRLDDFAGRVTLLIETQEEAFVAKFLVSEGQEVPVGSPVALLADEEGKIEAAAQLADLVVCHVTDIYDDKVQPQDGSIRTLVWQSYLKESSRDSGGCM